MKAPFAPVAAVLLAALAALNAANVSEQSRPHVIFIVAEPLHDAGYATGLAGKWHLGGTAPFHPQRRGFEEFLGFLREGHYYVPPPWQGLTTWLRRNCNRVI